MEAQCVLWAYYCLFVVNQDSSTVDQSNNIHTIAQQFSGEIPVPVVSLYAHKKYHIDVISASGVQEQAEDIPVLLKFPITSHSLPPPLQISGPCSSLNCLGHLQNVCDDDECSK